MNGASLKGPYPHGSEIAMFGLGCFWGAEKGFWSLAGRLVTAVGYAGGYTPNPTYEEVCSGQTGHTEAVLVVYDPKRIGYAELLKAFWEGHDPTQHMRQGADVGTQYRSAIYTYSERQAAEASQASLQKRRSAHAATGITTEMRPPASSISRRITTSNIWQRTRAAIAATAAPASVARLGSDLRRWKRDVKRSRAPGRLFDGYRDLLRSQRRIVRNMDAVAQNELQRMLAGQSVSSASVCPLPRCLTCSSAGSGAWALPPVGKSVSMRMW